MRKIQDFLVFWTHTVILNQFSCS